MFTVKKSFIFIIPLMYFNNYLAICNFKLDESFVPNLWF